MRLNRTAERKFVSIGNGIWQRCILKIDIYLISLLSRTNDFKTELLLVGVTDSYGSGFVFVHVYTVNRFGVFFVSVNV